MTEYSYELKVPKDRVAVLIGKGGKIKAEIEETTNSRIKIDSKEGDVTVSGEDTLGLFSAREVIRAISRGFNPEIAILLLKQDYIFEMINITEYVGKSKNHMMRVKGRIIGTDGKCRRTIEDLTETYICVYGKTIGIVGQAHNVTIARRAIENLLKGSLHSSVYTWLEKNRKMLKSDELFDVGMKEGE